MNKLDESVDDVIILTESDDKIGYEADAHYRKGRRSMYFRVPSDDNLKQTLINFTKALGINDFIIILVKKGKVRRTEVEKGTLKNLPNNFNLTTLNLD